MSPLWGCEPKPLPPGHFHAVVATLDAPYGQLMSWLPHLGLTNAHVYVYHRQEGPPVPAQYGNESLALPCNMTLIVRQLLPNKGRAAAAHLHHIVRHYDDLPEAMLLLPGPGPAGPHSLCGPLFRRARAYYRGTAERARRRQREAAAREAGRLRRATAPWSVYARFAALAATLSSGCADGPAPACCATYLCARNTPACPFAPGNCTREETYSAAGGGTSSRRHYLHAHGLYDPRQENMLLRLEGGVSQGDLAAVGAVAAVAARSGAEALDGGDGPGPLFLVDSGADGLARGGGEGGEGGEAGEAAALHPDYPAAGQPGAATLTRNETLQALAELLSRHNTSARRRGSFRSCGGAFALRRSHITRWPPELYTDLLAYTLDPRLDFVATRALSGPGWALWAERDYTAADLLLYLRVDVQLREVHGCPAPPAPALASPRGSGAAGGR